MIKQLFILLEHGRLIYTFDFREIQEGKLPDEEQYPQLITGLLTALNTFAKLQNQEIEYLPMNGELFYFHHEKSFIFVLRTDSVTKQVTQAELNLLLRKLAEEFFFIRDAKHSLSMDLQFEFTDREPYTRITKSVVSQFLRNRMLFRKSAV